jgi:hypothetical protein
METQTIATKATSDNAPSGAWTCTWPGCKRGPGGTVFIGKSAKAAGAHINAHKGVPIGMAAANLAKYGTRLKPTGRRAQAAKKANGGAPAGRGPTRKARTTVKVTLRRPSGPPETIRVSKGTPYSRRAIVQATGWRVVDRPASMSRDDAEWQRIITALANTVDTGKALEFTRANARETKSFVSALRHSLYKQRSLYCHFRRSASTKVLLWATTKAAFTRRRGRRASQSK